MSSIPVAGYIRTPMRTEGELKTSLESLVENVRRAPWSGQIELAHTIVSGGVTPSGVGGVLVIDTESAAATDDLNFIVTTNYPDGAFVLIRNANAARTVVVKHAISGIGTIQLDRSADYALDDTKKWLLIRRHGADWYELRRGPHRLVSETSVKTVAFTVNKQDVGEIFLCSGSYTVTLAAVAGCGVGFVFGIRNTGTGTIVIDPNSSELIDGATVLAIPPGWSFQIMSTGSAWITTESTGPSSLPNPIINGAMEVWQRGAAFAVSLSGASSAFLADKWNAQVLGATHAFTVNRSTNVPTMANAGVLFNYSLEVDVTTAYASPATADAVLIRQNLEGGLFRHFHQRQLTLSFWVSSTKTGVHSVSLVTVGGTRSCVGTYTVNVANTWEYKSITFPASPSTFLPNQPQSIFMYLSWCLQAGTTYKTSSTGVWLTTTGLGMFASTSQVNVLDNTSNVWRLTGVKLELGAIATAYDVTSFDEDYLRCLRYYQKSAPYGTPMAQNLGSNTGEFIFTNPVGAVTVFNAIWVPYYVPLAAAGATFLYNPNAANGQIRNRNTATDCTGSVVAAFQQRGFQLQGTTPSGSSASHTMAVHWDAQVA